MILSYLTVMMGFYFSSYAQPHSEGGVMTFGLGNKAYGFEMGGGVGPL